MGRCLFTATWALSLLLGAGVAFVWQRSEHAVQQVTAYRHDRYSVVVDGGHFRIEHCTCGGSFTSENGPVYDRLTYSDHWQLTFGPRVPDRNGECDLPPDLDLFGRPTQEARDTVVAGPVWPVIATTLILPLVAVVRRLFRARARPGRCSRCGYDLRASTDCCPECGSPIAKDPVS